MSEIVKIGDWCTLIHGDALVELPKLAPCSVDMVFCDPPYGHNNNNNGDLIARREAALGRGDYVSERDDRPIANDGPEANELFSAVLPMLDRLLSPGCCCCCGGGGPDPMFARWSLALDDVFDFKQMVVWDKGPMGMGWHYRRSYETVLVAQKPNAACRWFDDSNAVENIIRPGQFGIHKIIPQADEHPTAKPPELAQRFILLHTKPFDVVLDWCMGHASTAIACLNTGRRFVGIELDAEHFDKARRRIEAEAAQLRMF